MMFKIQILCILNIETCYRTTIIRIRIELTETLRIRIQLLVFGQIRQASGEFRTRWLLFAASFSTDTFSTTFDRLKYDIIIQFLSYSKLFLKCSLSTCEDDRFLNSLLNMPQLIFQLIFHHQQKQLIFIFLYYISKLKHTPYLYIGI